MKEITIQGIPSGDHECWCLLVTREDFKRIKGIDPEEFDEGPFAKEGSPYRYMLNPLDLILDGSEGHPKTPITLHIKSSYTDE